MIRRLMLAIALLVLCLAAAPPPASAFSFFNNPSSTGVCDNSSTASSTVCKTQNNAATDSNGKPLNPLTGPDGTLAKITNIVAFAAGAAAVIIIIVSALKLVTSGSNVSTGSRTDTDVEDARRGIGGAVIGLVVIVLARTLIMYVVDRL